MRTTVEDFELAVRENWSRAVMAAISDISWVRGVLLSALQSSDAEVRRAAVAALNDADDADAHDHVRSLADDPDGDVREEVLEYLEQFPQLSDAKYFLRVLKTGRNRFLASSSLVRLFGAAGPLVEDEDPEYAQHIEKWEGVLRARGVDA